MADDPLTALLLVVWLSLTAYLVSLKPHMAIVRHVPLTERAWCPALSHSSPPHFPPLQVPGTIAGFSALAAALRRAGVGRKRSSLLTAATAALTLSVGSAAILVALMQYESAEAAAAAAASAPVARLWKSTAENAAAAAAAAAPPAWLSVAKAAAASLLEPTAPAALAPAARAVVGTAAGFSALRAWEGVRSTKRDWWEAAAYTVSLVCGSAALFHNMYLVPLALCQVRWPPSHRGRRPATPPP